MSRSERLFDALRSHSDVVGKVLPEVDRSFDILNKLRHAYPERDTWRARAYFNAGRFDALSASVSRQLADLPDFDLVLHFYPILCRIDSDHPYVVITDNTMAVTQRSFRRWAKLSRRETEGALARERDVFLNASYVATWGSQARASAIDDYGCAPDRVVAIGYGLTIPLPPIVSREDRQEVLFVATSFWRKGGATLLDAWRRVAAELPDARLTVAGPRHRPPRDLPASITWAGPQDANGLQRLYSAANVFVLPTLFESSLPNVIREAMAFGLPVVASDVSGIAADAPDGVTLFPTGDADALAERLLELLRAPGRAAQIGLELREEVAEKFTWERVARHLAALADAAAREPAASPDPS